MPTQQFPKALSVVLDASGVGTVALYPNGGDWVVTNTAVSVSSAVSQPVAKLYRTVVASVNLIEGSDTGANDSSDTRIVLRQNESLLCQWTGGDAGAQATMVCQIVQYPYGQAPLERGA